MAPPQWINDLGEGFNVTLAATAAYCAFTAWIGNNLAYNDVHRIYLGMGYSWPWPRRNGVRPATHPGQITSALQAMPTAIDSRDVAQLTARQCYRLLIVKLHIDRYVRAEARVYYAAMH